jgi:hypothetical protein
MTSVLISIAVAIFTFAGGIIGLYLNKLLPEQHSVDKAREMIGSVIGFVTLLLALVLGTIIGSGVVTFAAFTCQPLGATNDRIEENQRFREPDDTAEPLGNRLFLASVTMPPGPRSTVYWAPSKKGPVVFRFGILSPFAFQS